MEDFWLVMKMKQGDEAAFSIFVRKYYTEILQYCRYHCFDMEYAQDLTQETFLKFFSGLQSYQHRGKTKNYLYTIAGNLCKNLAKKKRDGLMEQEILERELASGAGMEQVVNKVYVEQALTALAPELREVIILFYFQDCKLTEIAKILKISLPLVKYRLKRGREVLNQLLDEGGKYIDGKK